MRLFVRIIPIKSLLLSHHHSTCALVSEILERMLQTMQKQFTYRQYILTDYTDVSKPGGDAAGQDALHSAGVEGSEDSGARSKLPQPSQEEEALMCRLQHYICVSRPCEILSDVNAEELKAAHPLHRCLVDVEWEVVLLTPFSQGTHLLSVGRLILVSDQAYHCCVISKFDDDVGSVCGYTVMCVQGVQRSTSVEDQRRWGIVAFSDHLTSACQEVQDPAAQRSV